MRELLILGVGPHATEMLGIIERINAVHPQWTVKAFVTTRDDLIGEIRCGIPIIHVRDAFEAFPAACAIPDNEWPPSAHIPRERLVSLIDPNSQVSPMTEIGLGSVIYPHCFVGANVRIGDFLFCLAGSVINHGDVIGDHVTIASGVMLAGGVTVESDCYLGQASTVREMVTIGRGSLIGTGSVVLHDVAPNCVMVGNPARRLRAREIKSPGARVARAVKRVVKGGATLMLQQALRARTRYVALLHSARR